MYTDIVKSFAHAIMYKIACILKLIVQNIYTINYIYIYIFVLQSSGNSYISLLCYTMITSAENPVPVPARFDVTSFMVIFVPNNCIVLFLYEVLLPHSLKIFPWEL